MVKLEPYWGMVVGDPNEPREVAVYLPSEQDDWVPWLVTKRLFGWESTADIEYLMDRKVGSYSTNPSGATRIKIPSN